MSCHRKTMIELSQPSPNMINWVVGSSGLLGSSVIKYLPKSQANWSPTQRLEWMSNTSTDAQNIYEKSVEIAVNEFAAELDGRPWTIFWCAGVGTVSTNKEYLDLEVKAIRFFVNSLLAKPQIASSLGKIFFASSAGGVYAGSSNPPFDENTSPVAISDYGYQKLEIEEFLRGIAQKHEIKVVIGRIANLYGQGQDRKKKQGLVSAIVRSNIANEVVRLYVPLQTIRNYIYVDDAAKQIIFAVRNTESKTTVVVICSLNNSSVSSLLSTVQSIFNRKTLVALSVLPESRLQPVDLRLTSIKMNNLQMKSGTPLIVGINNLKIEMLRNLQKSSELIH